jgi:predicted nucleic acid-binding protein
MQVHPHVCVAPEFSQLGPGEQQAISLALAIGATLLLCDDRDARETAERSGLRVTGTIGVLQQAARIGRLNLRDTVARLSQTSFRMSRALLEQIRRDESSA